MENHINNIIRQRRSIYPHEFNGEKLEDSVIHTLLENANFAPNHKGNYPWRFVVMKDDSLITWIDIAAELYIQNTSAEKFKQIKLDKILSYKKTVSHALAIVMLRDTDSNTILNEDICAVAASVQNIYLSLSQFDHVGGYWSTGLGTYSADMHSFLKLNSIETLLGFFILGTVVVKRTEAHKKDYKQFVRYL